jgi:uroporphyrinogen-III decarboxylase
MTPKEVILKAYEGGKPDRLPVTLFGAGMWSIKRHGTSFEALSRDANKMTDMLVAMSETLKCDIVYPGSGYNNFHASALGGKIKFREMGAPTWRIILFPPRMTSRSSSSAISTRTR